MPPPGATMWCRSGGQGRVRSLGTPFEGVSGCGKVSNYLKSKDRESEKMAGPTGLEPVLMS